MGIMVNGHESENSEEILYDALKRCINFLPKFFEPNVFQDQGARLHILHMNRIIREAVAFYEEKNNVELEKRDFFVD